MESIDRKSLEENFARVTREIRDTTRAAGRLEDSVKLLAVSKTHPPAAIEFAYELGQRDFGENYVQELVLKAERLAHLPDLRLHLIGHLQTNKARAVAPLVRSVQTISSERLAHELAKRARERRSPEKGPLEVLIEVNIGREEQKSGVLPEDAPALVEVLGSEKALSLRGLMTVPPVVPEPSEALRYFRELAALRDRLGGEAKLPELSMGMSHDFREAIVAGATWVRVGTALFGSRPPKGDRG